MVLGKHPDVSSAPIKFKRRKSWNEAGHSHFLTFSTFHRKPYLQDERIYQVLAKLIGKAAKTHNYAVLAYVFMPDHVHLLVHPLSEVYDISAFLKSAKQGASQSAKKHGWISTALWERGGGYDSNISNLEARREIIGYIHQNPVRKELVDDPLLYRWSSTNWFVTDDSGDIECRHYLSLFY